MNARELYDAIQRGRREDQQQVLFELLSMTQTLSTAVIELAGHVRLKGHDPLSSRSRLLLSCFGESSQPSNEFKTRMHCITGVVSDIDALQPASEDTQ